MIAPTRFFVIGAGKSGTTSLHHYLAQHPDIALCRKEANWYAFERQPTTGAGRTAWPVTEAADYAALFEDAGDARALGDVSPVYLRSPGAAARIAAEHPDARIVVILRDPVQRALSHYAMSVRDGLETRDLDVAVRAEAERPEPALPNPLDCRYLADGEYGRQLAPWLERFDAERVRVLLHEDLRADPEGFMRDLFGFLGVNPEASVDVRATHNRGGAPRSRLVQYVLRPRAWTAELRARLPSVVGRTWEGLSGALKRRNAGAAPPPPDPATVAWLREWFASDVEELQRLTGLDVGHWLPERVGPVAASRGRTAGA